MKSSQIKMGIVLSYTAQIIHIVMALVYTPLMLRLLGQSEYGLYQLVFTVVSYLGLLSFGFGSAYVRFYSRFKAKNDINGIAKLNGMFMTVFIIIAGIAVVAGGILVMNIETILKGKMTVGELDTARVLMGLMVVNIAVTFPSSVFDCNITAREQFIFQRIVTILQYILNPFLTLPLLLMGYKSISLVVITTILTFLKLIINGYYCIKKLKIKFVFGNFEFALLREIWVFSFYIFLNMIVDQINWSVGKFILGKFVGTIGVAVFSVGIQINQLYMQLSTSISTVFIPRINKIVSESDGRNILSELFTRVGRIQFIILAYVLVGFIILGKFFILKWAGKGYDNSYVVVLLLIIPVTIPLIQNLGIEIQRAKNMHKFRSILYVFIAVFNIFISVFLVRIYNEIGAAIGTCFSLTVGNIIIMNWYYSAKVKLDMVLFWKSIIKLIPAVIISGLFGIILEKLLIVDNIMKFIFVGILYSVSYAIAMWYIGINNYERELFTKPIRKLLNRNKLSKI